MHFCDLHCDTAVELFENRLPLKDNGLCAVSLDKADVFEKYLQCAAVFTSTSLNNEEGYARFFEVVSYFREECARNGCALCTDRASIDAFFADGNARAAFLLTVEDARILNEDDTRLGKLYDAGVRMITPVWGGMSCIGGAHNTPFGLTTFGKSAMEEALARGILLDISHASPASAEDLFALTESHPGRLCASHSNACALTPHTRNLTDEQLRRLANRDGIVGVNLYVEFLRQGEGCSTDDVLDHMAYMVRLCGEEHVAFGCDLDGAETPEDLPHIAALPRLLSGMQARGFSEDRIEKLFWRNARTFLTRAL